MEFEQNLSHLDQSKPAIYVACLAAYNSGLLHGVWIDATQDLDLMLDQIHTMLANSPEPDAEEYAIHDYQNFQGVTIHEYNSIESVAAVAAFLEEHGPLGGQVLDYYGSDQEEAREAFQRYAGSYDSLASFAEELVDTSELPAHLAPYIDYEAIGRDIDLSGDVIVFQLSSQELHIFWSH